MATQGYFCMMYQVYIQLNEFKGAYGLYIQDHECIDKHCLANSKLRHDIMVISQDGMVMGSLLLFVERLQK